MPPKNEEQAPATEPPVEVETVQPPIANQVPGLVVLHAPPKKRPEGAFPAAPPKPKCFSAFHDRPFVDLRKPPVERDPDDKRPLSPVEAAPVGVFDTKKLPAAYFSKDGKCPCGSGRPVSEAQRAKQIVRIARRDPQAWVEQGGPTR